MAEKTAAERIDKFESLPTLPAVVVRVLEVVLDSESSAKDAAEIVASDPALAAKVLKIVNSPAYGLRQKISTIGHAVAMLGFATLKGLVLSVSVFDELLEKREPTGLDKALFWQHSLAVGAAAKSIAAETGFDLPEEAYVAGLLHDVGKVVMDFTMKEKYAEFIERVKVESLNPIALESAELGMGHAEAGGQILARWNLPPTLQQAVRYHHEEVVEGRGIPERAVQLASIVHLADFICWAQGIGSIEVPRPPTLAAHAESRVKLDRRKTDRVMEAIELELKRLAEIFNLQVPDLKRFRQALLRANVELGKINALYDQAKRQLERQVTELTELNEAIRRARQTLDPDKVRRALLEGVQRGLGFDRAFFFIVDETQKTLTSADMIDSTNVPMGPSSLVIEAAAARTLLELCSAKPDPFLFDQSTAGPGSDILPSFYRFIVPSFYRFIVGLLER
jgi:putative nucleotidyltransferase with HDIG domain